MKILGRRKLERRLAQMPETARAEIRIAMEKSADEIVAGMKLLVPVDTGKLRDTVGWTWGEAPKGALILGRTKKASIASRAGLSITIYAGDETTMVGKRSQFQLARLIEFGTVEMAAQPFFFPAWRLGRKRARRRIARAASKAAKKVAAG